VFIIIFVQTCFIVGRLWELSVKQHLFYDIIVKMRDALIQLINQRHSINCEVYTLDCNKVDTMSHFSLWVWELPLDIGQSSRPEEFPHKPLLLLNASIGVFTSPERLLLLIDSWINQEKLPSSIGIFKSCIYNLVDCLSQLWPIFWWDLL
jgi:hypothetical protein